MDLPDDRQHSRAAAARARQPGRGVEQAGTWHHAHRRRAAGRLCGAHRQIRASLLVARDDHLQPVAGIDDSIEERIVLHPR